MKRRVNCVLPQPEGPLTMHEKGCFQRGSMLANEGDGGRTSTFILILVRTWGKPMKTHVHTHTYIYTHIHIHIQLKHMAQRHAYSQPIQAYGLAPHNRNIWPSPTPTANQYKHMAQRRIIETYGHTIAGRRSFVCASGRFFCLAW